MDIVMTGYAGLCESMRLAKIHRETLRRTLSEDFLDLLTDFVDPVEEPGVPFAAWEPIGEGGVFAALWRLAEQADTGITAELARIPVRQETIEVCEILDVNPYQIPSGGYLYLVENSGGCKGTVIGWTSAGRARTVVGREGMRYLDKVR